MFFRKFIKPLSDTISSISTDKGIPFKLRTFLPPYVGTSRRYLSSLYNTLILPYLNSCNIVCACSSNNQLYSLSVIKNLAIRICTLSHPQDHTAPLFTKLNTLMTLYMPLINYIQGQLCTVETYQQTSYASLFIQLYSSP